MRGVPPSPGRTRGVVPLAGRVPASGLLSLAALLWPLLASGEAGTASLEEADAAFARRDEEGSAARAVDLYAKVIDGGGGYEACWKGARAALFYGYFVVPESRRPARLAVLKRGAGWAERAASLEPGRAEGHFYRAALLGCWAEVAGWASALTVAGEIGRSADKALAIDRGVACAGPLRLLGRYRLKLPAAFGGSAERSKTLLEEAVRRCPTHPQAHLFLAETLGALGRTDEARAECQWVLDHAGPGYEHRRFRRDAAALLEGLR